jgi:hypothetical protein
MPGKRTLLWDWTLTRDYKSSPAIQASAKALKANGPLGSVANWNTWRPAELPDFLHFQPQVRTAAQLEGSEWTNLLGSVEHELAKGGEVLILGFNEPERIPLPVAQAVQLWRQKLVPLRRQHAGRVQLVSPSCASDDHGSQWIADFMAALHDDAERPDFLGAHFYTAQGQSADQGLDAAKKHLGGLHAKFPQRPLVVSEIACTSRDGANVDKFTHDIVAWMNGQDWIKEFGLFAAMRELADNFVSPAAQLMDKQGNWTKLGKWWVGV